MRDLNSMPSLQKVWSLGTKPGALGCQFQSHDCLAPPIPQDRDKWTAQLVTILLCGQVQEKGPGPSRHPHCCLHDTAPAFGLCSVHRLPNPHSSKAYSKHFFFFTLRGFLHPFLSLSKPKTFGPLCNRTAISISKALSSLPHMFHMLN